MLDNYFDELIMNVLTKRQEELGLSGRELAKRANMPKSNWSAYVNLTRSMTIDKFKKVCEILGLDYEQVFMDASEEYFKHKKAAE